MKYTFAFLVLLIYHVPSAWAQTFVVLADSTHYNIVGLDDTLDIDYNIMTPFPDTASLDIDCDGLADLRFTLYTTPVMSFPSTHHIDIVNLIGDDLEMLDDGYLLYAYRAMDTIEVKPNPDWTSDPAWKVLSFHVTSGASWAGISGTDSLYVNDMYILFRKKIAGEWVYGWINYSGKSWETILYLRHFAIENEYCNSTAVRPSEASRQMAGLYPNPVSEELFLDPDPWVGFPLDWTLVDTRGIPVGQGTLIRQGDSILIGTLHLPDGMYFIRFQSADNATILHSRLVVLH